MDRPSLRDSVPSFALPGVQTPGYTRQSLRDIGIRESFHGAFMTISESKSILRKEVRERIRGITSDQRAALSGRACALLQRQTIWEKTPLIFFYAPLPDEVNV